jgi:hypothetical protein
MRETNSLRKIKLEPDIDYWVGFGEINRRKFMWQVKEISFANELRQ